MKVQSKRPYLKSERLYLLNPYDIHSIEDLESFVATVRERMDGKGFESIFLLEEEGNILVSGNRPWTEADSQKENLENVKLLKGRRRKLARMINEVDEALDKHKRGILGNY